MVLRWLASFAFLLIFTPQTAAASVSAQSGWVATTSATQLRWQHSITGLLDGRILVTGGQDTGGPLSTAEVYDPRADAWTAVGDLLAARYRHSAVLLRDGRVLVTGGSDTVGALASAELFDPITSTFSPAPDMAVARYWGTLTRLRDGSVLAIGGASASGPTDLVESFDPLTGAWTAVAPLPLGHARHVAVRLPDDRVMVAGGYDPTDLTSDAVIYDPDLDSWSQLGPLIGARYKHTAMVRPDGSVLVAAGYLASGYTGTTEILAPGATTFIAGPTLVGARGYHTSTGLGDGSMLLMGGDGVSTAELITPDNTVVSMPTLPTAHTWSASTLLPDGQVLIAGGDGTCGCAEAQTLARISLDAAGVTLPGGRWGHTLSTLPDHSLLLVGGDPGGAAVLRFSESGGWVAAPGDPGALEDHTATLLPDGSLLVVGGLIGGSAVAESWRFEPGPGHWHPAAPLPAARAYHRAVPLLDGRVLVLGGDVAAAPTDVVLAYDPTRDTWSELDPLPEALESQAVLRLDDGRVLVAGGRTAADVDSDQVQILDPSTGSWTSTGVLQNARAHHRLVALVGGRVLVTGGGRPTTPVLTPDEIWDPATGLWTTGSGSASRADFVAAPLPTGGAILVGGNESQIEWVNPRDGGRHATGVVDDGRLAPVAALDGRGGVLVVGGTLGSTRKPDGWHFRAFAARDASDNTQPTPLLDLVPPGAEPGAVMHFEIPNLSSYPEGGSGMMNSGATDSPRAFLQAWEGGLPHVLAATSFDDDTVLARIAPTTAAGWYHLSAGVGGQASAPAPLRVALADRRAFRGGDLQVEAGACSTPLEVVATDATGTQLVVATAQTLSFGSDGSTLSFHGDAACAGGPPVDIDPGERALSVRVSDPVAGVRTVWVTAPGDAAEAAGTRTVTVVPAPADAPLLTSDDGTARACENESLQLVLKDRFQNLLGAGAMGEAVQLTISSAVSASFAGSDLLGGTSPFPGTLLGALGASGRAQIQLTASQPGAVTVTASLLSNPGATDTTTVDFTPGGAGCRPEGPVQLGFKGGLSRAVPGQRIPFTLDLNNAGTDPVSELSLDFVCEGLAILEMDDRALASGQRRFLGDLAAGAGARPSGRALVEVGRSRASCRARASYLVDGVLLHSESAPWTVQVQRSGEAGGIACSSSTAGRPGGALFLLTVGGLALFGRRRRS